MLTFLKLTDKF